MGNTRYGRWEVIKKLGEGGQGAVFKVRDAALPDPLALRIQELASELADIAANRGQRAADLANNLAMEFRESIGTAVLGVRHGALKLLHETEPKDLAKALERMRNEIVVYEKIDHPNLIKILDKNIDDKWFVTEFQPGGTLQDHIELYKGNLLGALKAIRPLIEAVSKMHAQNLVHRDIKPGNIFFGESGELILGDAGLVFFQQDRSGHSRVTETFESVGTQDYMPGWAMSQRIDEIRPSFDVFSLGKVIWAMVAGRVRCPLWYIHRDDTDLEIMFPDQPEMRWSRKVLDNCVVEHEKDLKAAHASDLLLLVDALIKVLERGGQVLDRSPARPCAVCGLGEYEFFRSGDQSDARKFGLYPVDQTVHRIFVCNNCGHSQIFYWDNPTLGKYWDKKS